VVHVAQVDKIQWYM